MHCLALFWKLGRFAKYTREVLKQLYLESLGGEKIIQLKFLSEATCRRNPDNFIRQTFV